MGDSEPQHAADWRAIRETLSGLEEIMLEQIPRLNEAIFGMTEAAIGFEHRLQAVEDSQRIRKEKSEQVRRSRQAWARGVATSLALMVAAYLFKLAVG